MAPNMQQLASPPTAWCLFWSPRLPIYLIRTTARETLTSQSDYVKNWKDKIKETYHLALQHSNDRKAKVVTKNNTKRPCLAKFEAYQGMEEVESSATTWNKKCMFLFKVLVKIQWCIKWDLDMIHKENWESCIETYWCTMMIYWTIMIVKTDRTANSPTKNHDEDHHLN